MTEPETSSNVVKPSIAKLPLAAALVALVGIADAIYLTVHHYAADPVPCGAGFDCEMVLTSPYATLSGFIGDVPTIGDIPLSVLGAAAYFIAFSLALLAAFGDRRMWRLFGIQATIMAIFSGLLIYVQAARIHAFCQFCLISATTTFILFLIYLASALIKPRSQ